ncbi:amino acid transporter protein [Methylobacterium flocculans]|uniref:amino acid transporter protein n=1 Tax=Methylobacterium flocculans TaxID=2984843 RepID=UPI0021F313BE|nr:amino acid transporter protein [Methylobacterium sp. FF17]
MSDSADLKTKLVANERAKLSATYLNGLAVAVFAVGGLAPVFSTSFSSAPLGVPLWVVTWSASICWIVSVVLHLVARRFLRELEP